MSYAENLKKVNWGKQEKSVGAGGLLLPWRVIASKESMVATDSKKLREAVISERTQTPFNARHY